MLEKITLDPRQLLLNLWRPLFVLAIMIDNAVDGDNQRPIDFTRLILLSATTILIASPRGPRLRVFDVANMIGTVTTLLVLPTVLVN